MEELLKQIAESLKDISDSLKSIDDKLEYSQPKPKFFKKPYETIEVDLTTNPLKGDILC